MASSSQNLSSSTYQYKLGFGLTCQSDQVVTLGGGDIPGGLTPTVYPHCSGTNPDGDKIEIELPNPTRFTVRPHVSGTLSSVPLHTNFDTLPSCIAQANRTYTKARADFKKSFKAMQTTQATDSPISTWGVRPMRKIGAMVAEEMISDWNSLVSRLFTWQSQQARNEMTLEQMDALKRMLPSELYHLAVASSDQCFKRIATWCDTFYEAAYDGLEPMMQFYDQYATQGATEDAVERGASLRHQLDKVKNSRRTIKVEMKDQRQAFAQRRKADQDVLSEIYATASQMSYAELADVMSVLTDLFEMTPDDRIEFDIAMEKNSDTISQVLGDQADTAAKVENQLSFVRRFLTDSFEGEDGLDLGNASRPASEEVVATADSADLREDTAVSQESHAQPSAQIWPTPWDKLFDEAEAK